MITKEQALEALDVLKGYAPVWVEDKANTVQNYIEQSHPVPGAMKDPKNEDAEWVRGYRTGWNSCRATMLAAAPKPGADDD